MYRPPKVLKLYVLMRRFQICKQNHCRPNGSGDIAFQSVMRKLRQDFWRNNTFVCCCLLKALYNHKIRNLSDYFIVVVGWTVIVVVNVIKNELSIDNFLKFLTIFKIIVLNSYNFYSRGRTDLQRYSNLPSWSTDSKNVKNIFLGSGVQVQH